MKYFTVSVQRCENPTTASDTKASITAKMRSAAGGGDYGSWVGPSPRVVRQIGGPCISVGAEVSMYATWIYAIPEISNPPGGDAYYDHLKTLMLERLSRALGLNEQRVSRSTLERIARVMSPVGFLLSEAADVARSLDQYSIPVISPYDPRVNGPLEWWRSGQAAVTATGDRWTPGGPTENPIGPNPLVDQSGGPLEKYLKYGAIATGSVAAVYLTYKVSSFFSQRSSAAQGAKQQADIISKLSEIVAEAQPKKKKGFFSRKK
jgi:hypothetical protein